MNTGASHTSVDSPRPTADPAGPDPAGPDSAGPDPAGTVAAGPTPPTPPTPPMPPTGETGRVAARRRRRRNRILIGVGVLAVVAVAGVATVGFGGGDSAETANVGLPPATAQVTRATLTETEKVDGTLGYGDAKTISARSGLASSGSATAGSGAATGSGATAGSGSSGAATNSGAGTFTWLPDAGVVLKRGGTVYRVDNEPIPLIYGSVPLYRVLRDGVSGPDVKELEQNLKALGYTGFTVDDDFTSATADVVEQWQSDLGRAETGTVDLNQVVVAAGAIRVASVTASVGSGASGAVLTYTGTTRTVSVDLDVAKQQLVKKGITATVTLPDGSTVDGIVDSVGTVATSASTGSGQNASTTTTIKVGVTIADQKALGTLDAAPVSVTLVSDQRENVLTVPVAALVALAEGGYGVQVVEGTSTRYVAVETGMFANGRVEVTGDIAEGALVGIPK